MLAKAFWSMAACRTQSWLLPRAAISDLKARLGPGLPAPPTANDLLCALLAGAAAWLGPGRVAERGGLNVNVVINARGWVGGGGWVVRWGARVGEGAGTCGGRISRAAGPACSRTRASRLPDSWRPGQPPAGAPAT
jgi:hypothetical protein